MAVTVSGIQGSKFYLGPDLVGDAKLIVPGTSDYVTGGYAITAQLCGFGHLQQAWVSGGNSTAFPSSGGWYAVCVFPIVQFGAVATGAGFTGYTQFLFKVYVASTGVEAASGTNLTGNVWSVMLLGY